VPLNRICHLLRRVQTVMPAISTDPGSTMTVKYSNILCWL